MINETQLGRNFLIEERELVELLKLWATIRYGEHPDGDWLIMEERPGVNGFEILFRWTAKTKEANNAD